MRANLPQREPELLRRWEAADLYGELRARGRGRPRWILHDGPPYANGHIHMGTALNKVLKDIVVKSRTMLGHDAVYVPGWDCHGLPIEHQVDKELGLDKAGSDVRRAMDPAEKRRRCRAYALRFIDIQRGEFRRLGVFGDWAHPYLTMAPAYQATIVREFGRFVGRGLVYKGLKPVHWCMHCKTALAQAEVEYEEQETPSVYVKFPLVAPVPGLARRPASVGRHLDDDSLDPAGQPGRRGEPEREVRRPRHGRRDAHRGGGPRRPGRPGGASASPRAASGPSRGPSSRGSSTGIPGSSARAGSRRPRSSRWTREPAWSTSPRVTARRTTSSGGRSGCRSTIRSTTTGASSPRSPTSPGSRSGTRTRGSSRS